MHTVKTIGMFNYGLTGGGIERVVANLAALWSEGGYRVVVFTDTQISENDDFHLPSGVTHVVLAREASARSLAWCEAIVREKIDVVVYHQYLAHSLIRDRDAVKKAGAAFCVVFHNSCWGERYGMDEWSPLLTPECYPKVDAAICLSPLDALWWGTRLKVPVYYIANPVPKALPPRKICKARTKDVVWVGRFAKSKRLEDALQAFALVVQHVQDCRLVILGSSMVAATDRQYRSMARRLGIEDRVVFAGKQKEVSPFFERAYLYLQTSVCESFSLTLAESKAFGVPAVMYDLPYLTLAGDSQGVVPVDRGDIEGLAQAMVSVLQDENLHEALGEAARGSLSAFGDDRILREWERVFSLMGDREKTGLNGDLDLYQTVECYQLGLNELLCSWHFFMSEHAWKIKVANWLERHVPLAWFKHMLRARRPDLFAIATRMPKA